MEGLLNTIKNIIKQKEQYIIDHYQEDYQLMLDTLNEYIESDYNIEIFDKLLSFKFLKNVIDKLNLETEAQEYYYVCQLDNLLKQDFLSISSDEYVKIINHLQKYSSILWSEEQFKTLQSILSNDSLSISKKPIIDSIEDKKIKIEQIKNSVGESLEHKVGLLNQKIEQKLYNYNGGNNISLEMAMCREEINKLNKIYNLIDNNEACKDFVTFREVIQFIRNSSIPDIEKQKAIKLFYLSNQKNLLAQIHRGKIEVNESISQNTDDVLNEINSIDSNGANGVENSDEEDKYLTFDDIISVETLSTYSLNDKEKIIFDRMKNYVEIYLKNNIFKEKIRDEFMTGFVSICSIDENYRKEYYLSEDKVNWDFVLVDLYLNRNNQSAILDICNQLENAISIEKKLRDLSNLYLSRTKKLTEISEALDKMYAEIIKMEYSATRDKLSVDIVLIQDQLNDIDEKDDQQFNTFINNYNNLVTKYQDYINNDVHESTNSNDEEIDDDHNLIVFSPNFLDQCLELYSMDFYREIKKSISDLSSKSRMDSLVKKRDKFKLGDKLNGYVSQLKTTNTILYVSKINDDLWCVCGVGKKNDVGAYDKKHKSTINYSSKFRDEVKKWAETKTEEETKQFCDEQMRMVQDELSRWDNDKESGKHLGGSDGDN